MPTSIAIVTPTFPPYRGGIGKVAQQDAAQLAGLGFEAHVYAPSGAAEAGYAFPRLTAVGKFGNAACVPGVMGLPKKYPVVILHYPFFGGAEPLVLAKRLAGPRSKLIIVYHMDVVGSGPLRAIFAAHARFFRPWILNAADRLLVTSFDYARSGAMAEMVARRPELFRELAPSVDAERFRPGPKSEKLMARHGFVPGDRVVLFVGGLDRAHYFKGVPLLLQALTVKDLAGVKALIVGGGELRGQYEEQARVLGLAGRVVFAGGVSEEELPDYYRLGDIFAFPSIDRSEAFGIAALEALASGLPVVSSDLPGVRTIVREGETGFRTTPGSASALAEGLIKVIADDGLRKRLGQQARAAVEKDYSESARAAKWRAILAELRP